MNSKYSKGIGNDQAKARSTKEAIESSGQWVEVEDLEKCRRQTIAKILETTQKLGQLLDKYEQEMYNGGTRQEREKKVKTLILYTKDCKDLMQNVCSLTTICKYI